MKLIAVAVAQVNDVIDIEKRNQCETARDQNNFWRWLRTFLWRSKEENFTRSSSSLTKRGDCCWGKHLSIRSAAGDKAKNYFRRKTFRSGPLTPSINIESYDTFNGRSSSDVLLSGLPFAWSFNSFDWWRSLVELRKNFWLITLHFVEARA